MDQEPNVESVSYEEEPRAESGGAMRKVLLVVGVLYVAASLYLLFETRSSLEKAQQQQAATEAQVKALADRVTATRSELKADSQALAEQIGMTQKDLASRAAALQRQQREAESRLSAETKQQLSSVTGEVAGVKTDVGNVKTDVAATKADLESAKAKLERAIGDLGIQSGLIAHTRDELEILKHRGDRNYYEFNLAKNSKSATPVGTISLQLKKTDPKKGRYTLNVLADDRTIEKKDRNLNEPIQFYSGRDRQLYEIVVFTIDKDKVAGYLSTPKGSPTPIETGRN
ncbi:MAG TPA: hypothetical protein VFA60_10005 [Terriglobales bacterium]|nr:hypothetical protein [Terriglobales bacterium]